MPTAKTQFSVEKLWKSCGKPVDILWETALRAETPCFSQTQGADEFS